MNISHFLCILLFFLLTAVASVMVDVHATKGKFFVYMLHSGNFFPNAVEVRWSASLEGRAELPQWLHLYPSRHAAIAYLLGTPVRWSASLEGRAELPQWLHLYPSRHAAIAYLLGTPVSPVEEHRIHVLARRLDNFDIVEKTLRIAMKDDTRFNGTTEQLAEVLVSNFDVDDFLNDRTGMVERLETAIRDTFRGRNVTPYIFDLRPAMQSISERKKAGTLLQIGTQHRFHEHLQNLARGILTHPQHCNRTAIIPLDRHFAPLFIVDWCRFIIRNKSASSVEVRASELRPSTVYDTPPPRPTLLGQRKSSNRNRLSSSSSPLHRNRLSSSSKPSPIPVPVLIEQSMRPTMRVRQYFWESVFIFPMLAVICVLLVLLLSVVFFGHREGQHWRDYKTPREQLEQFVNVRAGQRTLRDLSSQRQQLLPVDQRAASSTPSAIHNFLQPRRISSLSPKEPGNSVGGDEVGETMEERRRREESQSQLNVPVGKQTVAEAAKASGSSIHLYRNPYEENEGEEEEEEEEEESDEKRDKSDKNLHPLPLLYS